MRKDEFQRAQNRIENILTDELILLLLLRGRWCLPVVISLFYRLTVPFPEKPGSIRIRRAVRL